MTFFSCIRRSSHARQQSHTNSMHVRLRFVFLELLAEGRGGRVGGCVGVGVGGGKVVEGGGRSEVGGELAEGYSGYRDAENTAENGTV